MVSEDGGWLKEFEKPVTKDAQTLQSHAESATAINSVTVVVPHRAKWPSIYGPSGHQFDFFASSVRAKSMVSLAG